MLKDEERHDEVIAVIKEYKDGMDVHIDEPYSEPPRRARYGTPLFVSWKIIIELNENSTYDRIYRDSWMGPHSTQEVKIFSVENILQDLLANRHNGNIEASIKELKDDPKSGVDKVGSSRTRTQSRAYKENDTNAGADELEQLRPSSLSRSLGKIALSHPGTLYQGCGNAGQSVRSRPV